jgi:hypothetical protein
MKNRPRLLVTVRHNSALDQPLRAFVMVMTLIGAVAAASALSPLLGAVASALLSLALFSVVSLIMAKPQGVCFANSFGTLTNTILIHDAFSLFLTELFPIRDMVLDVGIDGARAIKPGSTVTVKDWRSTVTAYEVSASTGYNTLSNATATDGATVTMPNKPWAVSIALTAEEYRLLASGATGGADYEAFRNKLREQMANSLGKKILASWFAIITAANYPNAFVTAAGTFSRATEIDLDTKFFQRNLSPLGTNGILAPATFGEWTKDHIAIQTNTAQNRQKSVLMSGGNQSQNSNFTLWRTNVTLPADAARGFIAARTHAIGAFRIPDEPTFENDPVSLNEVVDPATKLPMLARLWKDPKTGTIQLDLASIFVFAKGQPEALERLIAVAE